MNKLAKCENAFKKLKNYLDVEEKTPADAQEAVQAGVIQAFEFTYEVFWQYFQYLGRSQGLINISAPRHAFAFAYSSGLIENQDIWLSIMKSRNNTSHTYNEKIAEEIFTKIRDYYQYEFEKVLYKIKATTEFQIEDSKI